MPWHVKKKGSQYCVHEGHAGSGGAEVTCHPTEAKAKAHLRALYANEPDAGAFYREMEFVQTAFEEMHAFTPGQVTVSDSTGVGRNLAVLRADTPETRARGMVGATFEGFEAMLFVYEQPVTHQFHMNGVPEPLVIAWYDADGKHIGHVKADRGRYSAPGAYLYALELPVGDGDHTWLEGSVLTLEG